MLIGQALHGYSDGHALLATSEDLPRDDKHLMLALSDMSGRSMVAGFEEYLTAYPLVGAGFYAFAKTWYASEMERLGCVWTHTLLIRVADLAEIVDVGSLMNFFRRPNAQTTRNGDYSRSLTISSPAAAVTIPDYSEDLSAATLYHLYGSPNEPVFLPAGDCHITSGASISNLESAVA